MTSSAPTLRKYQTDTLQAIVAARASGQNRLLVKSPTGTGKTVMFASLLRWPGLASWLATLPPRRRKMLVIAHREELLDQAAEKILKQNPDVRVSVEQADRYASEFSQVVVASIQTLTASKCKRLQRLLRQHEFGIVIVDEAHHAAAPSYRTALVHLGFLPPAEASDEDNVEAIDFDDVAVMEQALQGWDARARKDQLLVGVTATPNRTDAIGLGCVFQSIAYSYGLRQAIQDQWLVPIKPWVVQTRNNLDNVKVNRGEFNQRELADEVNNPTRNKLAVAAWLEHAAGESTLAFTVDVAHAHALAQTFREAGIRAEALSGETPKDERRAMLAAYTRGDLEVITNCMVLTEGTDLPRTGCILHAKPTKSATLYEQMTGRGLRIHPGKTQCVVIDIVDIARKHSLQATPILYGLPPGLKTQGDDMEAVADEYAALLEKFPALEAKGQFYTLADLKAQCATFDVWDVPAMGVYGDGLKMNWIRANDELFRLSYPWLDGNETLSVEKNLLGQFDLVVTFREKMQPGEKRKPLVRQRTMAASISTAQDALQLAEAFVLQERRAVSYMKDKEASWRSRPATPKQIGLLTKWRAPVRKGLTMGEASEMIDLHLARRAR